MKIVLSISVYDLASAIGGSFSGDPLLVFSGVTRDTRTLSQGDMFVAIKGERVHGADLAKQALRSGASVVLTDDKERACKSGASIEQLLIVDDVIKALGKIATYYLQLLRKVTQKDLKVVAITGSVGKTTTKDLLAHICRYRGDVVATEGSLNNEIGLPLTVMRADENTSTLILEMGADHPGDITYLTDIVNPDVGAVIAIARAHVGEFGGIENIQKTKAEMCAGVRQGGTLVLNVGDPLIEPMFFMKRQKDVDVCTYAASLSHVDICASDIVCDEYSRASFVLHADNVSADVTLKISGEHHVSNALAAASIALSLGIPFDNVAEILSESMQMSPHRMNVHMNGLTCIIDDSYNANPDSMRAAIKELGRIGSNKEGKKIAVLGSMLELGDDSALEHKNLCALLLHISVDLVIGIGDDMRFLCEELDKHGVRNTWCSDYEEGLKKLNSEREAKDTILLKGSHGSNVWKIAEALQSKG
ncbi:MAG: UDP-N-acetylmuramoyl-tripeptide--D-alanyl-D-alanine ligase [Actinomycetaceae bacterium]|nr:UDP-N-acetylmuramoyl-tripeptide--D-alanyl-D-alanine ligase [Actinomycetaceae bacterium]